MYGFLSLKEGHATVSSEALNCDLDLWHDPMLRNSLFVSDRLCKALKKAKVFKQFRLSSCDIY